MRPAVIVQRELVVAGRRPTTYVSRCLAAALMATLFGTLNFLGPNLTPGSKSRLIFGILTWTTFAGTLLSGVFLTADALSSERREGTLGLLFLTELRGHDVVIGKLIASSIIGAYALVGILPVLAIPLLMGGVTGWEFAGTAVALSSTLLCSLGLGIYASARSQELAQAMGVMLLMLAAFVTLPLLGAWVLEDLRGASPMTAWIRALSPYSAVATATNLSVSTPRTTSLFLLSGGVTGAAGWVGVGLASHRLTRHWRTDGLAADRISLPRQISSERQTLQPNGRLQTGSICTRWYARQLRPTRALTLLARLVQVFFWICLTITVVMSRNSVIPWFIAAMFTAYGLHWIFKIQTALHATSALAQEAAQGGLELLLCTPLTPAQIILGHRDAVEHALRHPRRHLVLVNCGLLASTFNPHLQISSREAPAFAALFLGGLALLWADAYSIVRVGAWLSLKTRNAGRAVFRTLLVSYLPTLVGALLIFLVVASAGSGDSTWVFVGFELLLVGVAGVSGQHAATRIKLDFRRLACGSSFDSKTE